MRCFGQKSFEAGSWAEARDFVALRSFLNGLFEAQKQEKL
jgi:hypothetical protein